MPFVRFRSAARPFPFILALLTGVAALSPLHAHARTDGPDRQAPVIELEALAESVADRSQVFTAQVADDRQLESVTLYHRREGSRPFERAPMSPLGDTGYHSVSIPTEPDDLRAIEYYVQALDGTGNRTVEGYAFDPYRRTLLPSVPLEPDGRAAVSATDERAAPGDASPRRRWWAVALGVVAVGALASLAGGGGGDDEDGSASIVIDVQEPAL